MTFSATVAATLMSVSTINGGGAGTIPSSAAALAGPGFRAAGAIVRAVDSVLAEAPPAVVFDAVPLGLVEDGVAISADIEEGDGDWQAEAEVTEADFVDARAAAGLEPLDGESPEAAAAALAADTAVAADKASVAEPAADEAVVEEDMAEEVEPAADPVEVIEFSILPELDEMAPAAPAASPACVAEAFIPVCGEGCHDAAAAAEPQVAQEPPAVAPVVPVASVLDRAADAFAEIQADALRLADRLASLAERIASKPAPVTKDAAAAAAPEPQDEEEAEAEAMEEEPVEAADPADDESIDVHAIDEADILRDILEAAPLATDPVAEPEVPIY